MAGPDWSVQEVNFWVRTKKLNYIVSHDISGGVVHDEERVHQVFMVTLRHDMTCAIDLSAAQYGMSRTVTPWKQYEAEMITEYYGFLPLAALGTCGAEYYNTYEMALCLLEYSNNAEMVSWNDRHKHN